MQLVHRRRFPIDHYVLVDRDGDIHDAQPVIDDRLVARGAPDQPLERATELKAVLADPEWQRLGALALPWIQHQENRLLKPTAFSPAPWA